MKEFKKVLAGLMITLMITSCSVQQFAVNTEVKPFQNGGKVVGERTKGKEFRKTGDLILLGFNIKKSDSKKMVDELNATSYTIETKSNVYIYLLTFGILDYKIVKVIKRSN